MLVGPLEAFDYRGAVDTVDRLITRFGAYGSIRHEGVDYQCLIVTTNYSQRDRNSNLELMSSQRCYMSPTGIPFVPTNYDIITLPDGSRRRIRNCFQMKPAKTVIYFELQIEGP